MSHSLNCCGDSGEHFRQIGELFELAFRDLAQRDTIFTAARIVIVAEALCSTISGTRDDAKSELSRLQISAARLRDYCRITGTRLPAVAAKRRGVSEYGIPTNPVPPHRDLTKVEIEQAQAPWAAALQEARKRPLSEELRLGERYRWVKPASRHKAGPWTATRTADGSRNRKQASDPATAPGAAVVDKPGASNVASTAQDGGVGDLSARQSDIGQRYPQRVAAPKPAILDWYAARVRNWNPEERSPNEKQDYEDAKGHFAPLSVNREWLREARRACAPPSWRAPGAKKSPTISRRECENRRRD